MVCVRTSLRTAIGDTLTTRKIKFEGTPEEALVLIDLLRAEGVEVDLDIRAEEAEES
jgi:hypothetical protein